MLMGTELRAIDDDVEGRIDAVYAIYNEFKSPIQQRVVVERLLPIDWVVEISDMRSLIRVPNQSEATSTNRVRTSCLSTCYSEISMSRPDRILLELSAAEQGARTTAMDGATRNAVEPINKLTIQYNKTRQAAITRELMDSWVAPRPSNHPPPHL